ncbi:MAG TPA: hypothetical protein VGD85_03965, partial [Nocardioides sp.]
MSFLGADTDELRDAGQVCQDGKETTDQVIAYLRALIAILRAASFFSGGASAAYATYLETVVVPWLQKISMALGLFAKVLNANAEAQDLASQGQSVDFGALPTYTPQVSGDAGIQAFAGSILGPLGQAAAVVGVVSAAVEAIEDIVDGDDSTGTASSVQPAGTAGATTIGATSGVDGGHHAAFERIHAGAGAGDHGGVGGGTAAGSGGGSVGGALGTTSIGTDSIDSGSTVDGGVDGDGTPVAHASGSTAGGFGGSTPGSESLESLATPAGSGGDAG